MSKCFQRLSRRSFLKGLGASGLTLGATAAIPTNVQAKPALQPDVLEKTEYVFTACDMCFNRCGVIAHVTGEGKNRRITKLDPNPKCAKSRGMLCARGNAGLYQTVDPSRLTTPLLRTGKRGSGQWKPLSWDEALQLAAEKMGEIGKKYTRCGMLFTAGADTHSQFVHRLAEAYGSFNITTHESLCLLSVNRAFMDTFGEVPQADVLHSDYILMLGANRFEALVMPDSADLMQALQRGAKLVVLDPRRTKTAELASEWHAIRPGTDMAFVLALCHVIIQEQRYDAKWIADNTSGFEELRHHITQYTPEWAEQQTGIATSHIVRIARELASAAPQAMVYPGRRSSDYTNSTQTRRAFAIINALLGNFDRQGGLMATPTVKLQGIPFDAPWYDDNPEDRVDANRVPLLFQDEGAFVLTRDAILSGAPYPVKGWLIYKTNPMATAPDREKTRAMMNAMEFIVTIDIAMSDTAYMSDLVLPSTSYLERNDPLFVLQGGPAGPCIMTRNQVVPPLGESRPAFDIMKDLSMRLNLGDAFNFTLNELRAKQMESFPGLQEALEKDGLFEPKTDLYGLRNGQPFKTPSKKIELYSQLYAEKGIDPLPIYTPPAQGDENTFRLVVGRNACITQSQSQNNPLLHEFVTTNELWIHPQAANKLHITHDAMVTVESPAGREHVKAHVTTATRPDTVYMHSGFGSLSPEMSRTYKNGASIAALLESAYDDICGNAALHTTHVRISPMKVVS